jgi:hypothetical protein
MELEPEPEPQLFKSRNRNWNHNFFRSRNRNRNHNFSKVGTGTVKNSYGSTTLNISEQKPIDIDLSVSETVPGHITVLSRRTLTSKDPLSVNFFNMNS